MDAILDWFDWFSDVVTSVFDWFSDFLENFINLFKYIAHAVDMAFDLIDFFPPYIQVFAIVTVTVSVIFLILGRSSGGKG